MVGIQCAFVEPSTAMGEVVRHLRELYQGAVSKYSLHREVRYLDEVVFILFRVLAMVMVLDRSV